MPQTREGSQAYGDDLELELRIASLSAENAALKAALEALPSPLASYREVLAKTLVACWIIQGGRIAFANSVMWKLLAAEAEGQVAGHAASEFIHPDSIDKVYAGKPGEVDAGLPAWTANARIVALDGSVLDVKVIQMPLVFEGEKAVQASFFNLSDQRKLESALQDAKRYLKLIADNTTEVILAYDMGQNLIYANPALEGLTGYSLSELQLRNFIPWMHPEDERRMLSLWNGVFHGRAFYEERYRVKTKLGFIRWSSATWTPLYDESGRQIGAQGRERDVTSEIHAEERIRQSEERFRTAFAHASVGEAVLDPAGRFLEVNEAFCSVTGYTEAELRNLHIEAIIHPEDWPECARTVAEMLAGKTPGFVSEKRYIRKNGSEVWVRNSVSLIRDLQGKPLHVLGLTEEISQRKLAEEAVTINEERFRRLFEHSPLGMMIVSAEGHFLRINPHFSEMVGYSPEELSAKHFTDITHPEDRAANLLGLEALKTGEAVHHRTEKRYLARDGRIVHAKVLVTILRAHPFELLVIAEDITDRKLAEDALQRSEEQLRHSQKLEAIGLLAGGIAHDFNNIVTVISGYSAWLLDRLEPGDVNRDAVRAIQEAGEKASTLTQQLLAFSRKQILQPRVFDLVDLVRRVCLMLERLIPADVVLQMILPDEAAPIKADPSQIEHAIVNLMLNAVDAMPGGGKLTIEVQLRVPDPELNGAAGPGLQMAFVALAFRDTGTGMSPEIQERIFEPFFTTKESGRGTGLGLPMAYGIAKQSGGTLTVHSIPEQGSTFTLYVPQSSDAPEPPHAPVQRRLSRRQKQVILLVEDHTAVREWGAGILRASGYTVIEAVDAEQALRLSKEEPRRIDLLVADVVMPGLNGRQLADQLSAERPGIKVLFTSGYSHDKLGELGVLEPNLEYLAKPFSQDALLHKVSEVIAAGSTGQIVLADDDADVRTVLAAILEHAGYVVRQAANGREAILACSADPPQLLITDIAMPEQEGIETIRTARREYPAMRILAITGVFTGSFKRVPMKLGADVVLEKPIPAATLLETVEQLIG